MDSNNIFHIHVSYFLISFSLEWYSSFTGYILDMELNAVQ